MKIRYLLSSVLVLFSMHVLATPVVDCLLLLDKTIGDGATHDAAVDMLLGKNERESQSILVLCETYSRREYFFVGDIKRLVRSYLSRHASEPKTTNSVQFSAPPITRYFADPGNHDAVWEPVSELVDVNGDGLPDYVVSLYDKVANLGDGSNHYYRAVFMNTGTGWIMTDCQTNIAPEYFARDPYEFLIPCP